MDFEKKRHVALKNPLEAKKQLLMSFIQQDRVLLSLLFLKDRTFYLLQNPPRQPSSQARLLALYSQNTD